MIYIANPKTGSSTVRVWFIDKLGGELVDRKDSRLPHSPGHDPFITPEIKGEYFLFTTIRCPFRLTVSRYLYTRRHSRHPVYHITSKFGFKDSLRRVMDEGRWPSQTHFLGKCTAKIDLFVRNEDGLFEQLSKLPGWSNIEPCRVNASPYPKPWHEFYDEETEQWVREYYANDFEQLDYPNTVHLARKQYPEI